MMSGLKAMEMADRISDLPQPILHQILSHLSQNDAVKTCVLSKSWRYLWYGRPNLEFCKDDFKGTVENFISVVDDTLIRYRNQNLSIQKIILKFASYFDQPWLVFECESLREIHLEGCNLFRHLQTLRLHNVKISNETFEGIMWNCHLIEEVSLIDCRGLNTIKVNYGSLKKFEFYFLFVSCQDDPRIEIADVSRVETIKIEPCRDWFVHHHNNIFTRLKSLCLKCVHLTTNSVDSFSCNFPCLEELELRDCWDDFEEIQLSSRSIKRLEIQVGDDPIKVFIDAPNLLEFEYHGYDSPSHVSFTTTSNKWKSKIDLTTTVDDSEMDISMWLHELDEFLKVLSRSSETFVHVKALHWEVDDYDVLGDSYNVVQAIEKHLELCKGSQLCSDYSVWYLK